MSRQNPQEAGRRVRQNDPYAAIVLPPAKFTPPRKALEPHRLPVTRTHNRDEEHRPPAMTAPQSAPWQPLWPQACRNFHSKGYARPPAMSYIIRVNGTALPMANHDVVVQAHSADRPNVDMIEVEGCRRHLFRVFHDNGPPPGHPGPPPFLYKRVSELLWHRFKRSIPVRGATCRGDATFNYANYHPVHIGKLKHRPPDAKLGGVDGHNSEFDIFFERPASYSHRHVR